MIMNEKVRIGIIGAGDIANRGHIPNYLENEDCHVISLCSRNKQNAIALANKYNIPEVDDNYSALLKRNDIDAISICTPPYTHKEIIDQAVANNKHILVEKPIALNYEETKWILSRVENYSKKFMVTYNNRYREENLWLKNKIEVGELGNLELIDGEWLRTKREISKDWLFKKDLAAGGVLADLGVHLIDLVLSFIKKRKKFSVNGYSKRINSYDQSDVEDLVVVMLEIDDKIIINLKMGWTLKLKTPVKVNIKFYGDRGEVSNSDYSGETSDGYKKLITDFIEIIQKDSTINHKIYADTMKLVDAIYESCKNKKSVNGIF